MEDINKRLMTIDEQIPDDEIFLQYGILSLAFYELTLYKNLTIEINKKRDNFKDTETRKEFINDYRKVYLAQRKKLKKILANTINRTMKIYPQPTKNEMERYIKQSWEYKEDLSLEENIYQYAETRIKLAINKVNEELFILHKYPAVYYNSESAYIGGEFSYRYEDEIIIYKQVDTMADGMHHYKIFSNDSTKLRDKRALLNILAYLNGSPNFEFLCNTRVNKKLSELYSNFDLLDCIRLRGVDYLKSDTEKSIYLELPIIKNYQKYKFVFIKEMEHEGILDLYHASLKQIEPLPRCVFLYRVFEYAAANHYRLEFPSGDYKPEDALNYYLSCAMEYNPNPLYFIEFGDENRKARIENFFTILKREAKDIFIEWSNSPYLKNKSKGEIIYLTGRNFTAHGASGCRGERNMQYDYDKNYLHINNINILLELIARYVIELLNPGLRNIVQRKKSYYLTRYKDLFSSEQKSITSMSNEDWQLKH